MFALINCLSCQRHLNGKCQARLTTKTVKSLTVVIFKTITQSWW